MNPKISYLIATKDRADMIAEAIQSMIEQDEKGWEAIIVDDNGSDNTREVVKSFQDNRLKYFKLPKVHGTGESCARNFAALHASAEIVAIMDSDDLVYPNRASLTIKAFEEDPDLDIFYGDIDLWDVGKDEIRDRKTPIAPFSLKRLLETFFIPHPTVAMRRSILLDNPYNQYFRIASDYDLMTRLAKQGYKFAYTTEKILKYRLGNQNVSGGGKSELTQKYDLLVKMLRGKEKFNPSILQEIKELEEQSG